MLHVRWILLIMSLAIGAPRAEATSELKTIVDDLTSMEELFRGILFIPSIQKNWTTFRTLKEDVFKFGDLTMEALSHANLSDLEQELTAIRLDLQDECGLPGNCEVAWEDGKQLFDDLDTIMSPVKHLPNLRSMSKVKRFFDSAPISSLSELADILDEVNSYPKGHLDNRKFLEKVYSNFSNLLMISNGFQELVDLNFDESQVGGEFEHLEQLVRETKLIIQKQSVIDGLNNSMVQLKAKVEKLLNGRDLMRSALKKLDVLRFFDGGQSGPEAQLLEQFAYESINPKVVQIAGISEFELKKLLKPAAALKKGSFMWRKERSTMTPPDRFVEKLEKIHVALQMYQKNLVRLGFSLADTCTKKLVLEPFVDNSSRADALQDASLATQIVAKITGTNATSNFWTNVKRFHVAPSTNNAVNEMVLKSWKKMDVEEIQKVLRETKSTIEKAQELGTMGNDYMDGVDRWILETGLGEAVECSVERGVMKKVEAGQRKLSSVRLFKEDDKDYREVMDFANHVGKVINQAVNEQTAHPETPVAGLPVFYHLPQTVGDLSAICKTLRLMLQVEKVETQVELVINGIKDSSWSLGVESLRKIWTPEAVGCLNRTLFGMRRAREIAMHLGYVDHMKEHLELFEGLYKLGPCSSGRLFKELFDVVPNGPVKDALGALKDIQLDYASAQYSLAVIQETELYFDTFQRYLKSIEEEKARAEEVKKQTPGWEFHKDPRIDALIISCVCLGPIFVPAGCLICYFGCKDFQRWRLEDDD